MRIQSERKRAKLNQVQLARLSGVDQSTISRLENQRLLDPSFETLQKLAWAFAKCGRHVDALDLHPRKYPLLIKGAKPQRRRRRVG